MASTVSTVPLQIQQSLAELTRLRVETSNHGTILDARLQQFQTILEQAGAIGEGAESGEKATAIISLLGRLSKHIDDSTALMLGRIGAVAGFIFQGDSEKADIAVIGIGLNGSGRRLILGQLAEADEQPMLQHLQIIKQKLKEGNATFKSLLQELDAMERSFTAPAPAR